MDARDRPRDAERLRLRARPGRRRHPDRRPALTRDRRALRARSRRSQALPRRPRRRQARRARRGPPLPGGPGLLRRRPHAARGDGRPGQRARDRRHRGHDRLRGPPGGLVAARTSSGCSSASRIPTSATARSRPRSRRIAPPEGSPPAAAALRHARERADQLRRRRRGRVGHPARAPGDQGGRRARRLRRPLRAGRGGHAGPLPDRRRAPGGRDRPAERGPRRHQPRQDPLRPRHRRAPHPAGRPHLAGRREQADRPARRHASRRLRREGRHANPRPEQGHDPARAAGHAAAGARAVHEGLRRRPTARCS